MATRRLGLVRAQDTTGASVLQQVSLRFRARRLGWREVANWKELHDAARK